MPYAGWPPPRTTSPILPIIIVAAVVIPFVVVFLVFAGLNFGGFGTFFVLPFCGFFLILLLIVVALVLGASRRTYLPPPPPVQQPMVPAGTQPPVALNCPNCGAPPQAVDRFGVATCPYCETRFIVR